MHVSVAGVAAEIYNMLSQLCEAACSLQLEQVMETSEGGTPRPFLQQAQMGASAAPGDTPVSPNEAVKGNAKPPGQSGRYLHLSRKTQTDTVAASLSGHCVQEAKWALE